MPTGNISSRIETGLIKNRVEQKWYPYEMQLLNADYLAEVVGFHNYVIDILPDRDLCWRFPPDWLERYLGEQAITVGVFVQGRLVGFRVLYFPGQGSDNPGFDIGLTGAALEQIAHLPLSNVHPDFTGNSLQRRMTGKALEFARQSRNFRYLCSIVSPKNYASMAEKFAFNMVVAQLKIKYEEFWRYIFYQDLQQPLQIITGNPVLVPCQDYSRQKQLLAKGYYGFQFYKGPGINGILFGKPTGG